MAGHAENEAQTVEAKDVARTTRDDERGVKFLGMKPLKVVRLKIGKEGKTSYHFSSSVGGRYTAFSRKRASIWTVPKPVIY